MRSRAALRSRGRLRRGSARDAEGQRVGRQQGEAAEEDDAEKRQHEVRRPRGRGSGTAGAMRSSWGIVMDGREGFRAEDRASGIHVHWVHVR